MVDAKDGQVQLSIFLVPGMIGYLLACKRPRALGFTAIYVLGYVSLMIVMIGDPLGLVAWLID